MDLNSVLIGGSCVALGVALTSTYVAASRKKEIVEVEEYLRIEDVLDKVKTEMVELVREDILPGATNEEFEKMYKRKARIDDALKNCVFGVDSAKAVVIDLIREIIDEHVPMVSVNKIIGLDEESEPSDNVMFEIIMYRYKKRYGKDAFHQWVKKYDLDRVRPATNAVNKFDKAYYITPEDLQECYIKENISLSIEERKDILAILVFQLYKGFGPVDTLREMNINGLLVGTSGSVLEITNSEYTTDRSVWAYFDGKYVHLRFVRFSSEEEVKRAIQLMIRWNKPGSLTEKRGYIVNTAFDKSRITALRPSAAATWAIFVRKFNLSDVSPEFLILKDYVHDGRLAIKLIEMFMRGECTTAFTGDQGSGKTTLMSSIVRFMDSRYNIRVLEKAFELYLNELYPTRNILSVQGTAYVTETELQDVLKKTDAQVSMVGEVASDDVAANMIQMGMTGSKYTIFSHHGNTVIDLILTLRNSLSAAGNFDQMSIAEKQVTDVVKMDVHLFKSADGKRYIDFISEVVQLDTFKAYPDYDENDPQRSFYELLKEQATRTTDRVSFTENRIMYYDEETDTYVPDNRMTVKLEQRLRSKMEKDVREEFDLFMLKYWGERTDEPDNILEYYGKSREETIKMLEGRNGELRLLDSELDGKVIERFEEKAKEIKDTREEDNRRLAEEFAIELFA